MKKSLKNNRIRIVIFPDEKHEPKNYSIKKSTLSFLIGIVITLIVFYLIGASTYFKLTQIALSYNELKGEKNVLIEQLRKLNNLERDFSKLKKYNNKVREIIGDKIKIENIGSSDSLNVTLESGEVASIFNTIPFKMPVKGYKSRMFDIDKHPALDISAESGTPIMATSNGRVLFSGWTKKYGNVIILFHGQDIFSIYKHNLRNIVEENKFVSAGQVIALLGGTGEISSGPHLHFEIWTLNKPVDPMLFIK